MIYKNKNGRVILTSSDLDSPEFKHTNIQAGESRFQLLDDNKISYYSQAKSIASGPEGGAWLAEEDIFTTSQTSVGATASISFNTNGTIVGTGDTTSFNTTWYTGGPYDVPSYTLAITRTSFVVTGVGSYNQSQAQSYTGTFPKTLELSVQSAPDPISATATFDVVISYGGSAVASGSFILIAAAEANDFGS